MTIQQFHTWDHVVFWLFLALTLGVGIVAAWKRRTDLRLDQYFLGGRQMSPMAIGVSIMASFLSGTVPVSLPVDTYYYGAINVFCGIGWMLGLFIIMIFFIPLYHKIAISTSYEYLYRRFHSNPLRAISSGLYTISMILTSGIMMYVPALSFSVVTGWELIYSVLLTGTICLIYTTLGGMRAVVWVDILQMIIMVGGMLALAILGSLEAGGATKVYDIAKEGGRFNFDIVDPDPRVRHSVWTQCVGQIFMTITMFGTSQMSVQRLLSVKNAMYARISSVCGLLMAWMILALTAMLGVVMYAYYVNCDPMGAGYITKPDELVTYFLMEIAGHLHGLPGLYLAAIFAGALSTVSSLINSLGAVCMEDLILPAMDNWYPGKMTQKYSAITSRCLVAFFGLLVICTSTAPAHMSDLAVQLVVTVSAAFLSPITAVFLMGIFVSWANVPGALAGLCAGLLIGLWMSIGAAIHSQPYPILPVSVENCTTPPVEGPPPQQHDPVPLQDFYDVSYAWYAMYTMITGFLVAVVVSAIVSYTCYKDKEQDLSLSYDYPCCPRSSEEKRMSDEKITGPESDSEVKIIETVYLNDTSPGVSGEYEVSKQLDKKNISTLSNGIIETSNYDSSNNRLGVANKGMDISNETLITRF